MKEFVFRVDLESDKGIKSVPRLLELLKKYGIRGSFYVVMGGESGPFEILKNRGIIQSFLFFLKGKANIKNDGKGLKTSGEREIKVWSRWDKLRAFLIPLDFVKRNTDILKKILEEGHELGIHGWKHIEWTRGLGRINIDERVKKAKKKYIELFGREAESFCSPAFNTNEKVVGILDRNGIKVIGDFEGEKPEQIKGTKIVNVPVTIHGQRRTPIIEYLVSAGKSDGEIAEETKKKILERDFSCFYIHGLFESIKKLNILEEIFKFVKENKIKSMRAIDFKR